MQRRSSRPPCGARTGKGTPCQGGKIPGRKRCRWHGGLSTGPISPEGQRRARSNLIQYRDITEESAIVDRESVKSGNSLVNALRRK